MNRTLTYSLCAVSAISMTAAASRSAISAGQGTALVRLQPTTPGVAQTGHLNINGTARADNFRGESVVINSTSNVAAINSVISSPVNYVSAVFGQATSTTGPNYGGYFYSAGANGTGVVGWAASLTGNPNGGYFRSDAPGGNGVIGFASATTGDAWGGLFSTASNAGIGVYAEATATGGTTYGGKFVNNSDGGSAVYGLSNSASGTGGYFDGAFIGVSGNGFLGVSGNSFDASGSGGFFAAFGLEGIGVWGRARGLTGLNYGVYGDTQSPAGWAGYFTGGKGIYAEKLSVGSSTLVTNLNADLLDDRNGAYYSNAANLTGTLADARLSNNVALLDAIQTFTAAKTFSSDIDVTARTTTENFTMLTGAAANTVLLGNVNGVASWGSVGNARLTSDAASLSKVTGGNFSISSGDIYGNNSSRIVLADSVQNKISITPGEVSSGSQINLYGANGNFNFRLTPNGSNPNHGLFGVYDSAGSAQAQIYVDVNGNGIVSADTKAFLVPDPADPRFNIMYACVEGPEAAMYTRGTGQLVNGRAVIDLPDHFLKLANMQTLTIQVTPLDECEGLFCKKLNGEIVVKELRKGQSNIEFDWEVKAIRKGHEDWAPVRPWDDALPEGDKKEMWNARLKSLEMKKNRGANRP